MKRSWIVSLAALAVILPVGFFAGEKRVNADYNEDGTVTIDETNFPDENFRAYVIEKIDTDGDKVLSEEEIKKTEVIDVANREITSLKGIEYFVKLQELLCNNNSLSSLDLSNNLSLLTVDCSSNQLTNIDLGENDALTSLHCEKNWLTKLDVSKCEDLNRAMYYKEHYKDHFYRSFNDMLCCYDGTAYCGVIDSDHMEYTFFCYDKNTRIISSETPELPELQEFSVDINEENFPDSSFRNFVTRFDENGDGSLDQDELYYIDTICVNDCSIESLKGIEYFSNLMYLYCNSNSLTELDLHENKNIMVLSCIHNKISAINISGTKLTELLEENYNDDENGCRQYPISVSCDWWQESNFAMNIDIGTRFIKSSAFSDEMIAGFVERLYTVAMNRVSDKDGKSYWIEEINSGRKTGGECAHFFLIEAPEFMNRGLSTEDFVETLYKTFFDRESEAEGKAYWVGELKNNTKSREDVINGFIDSAEWCNICASYGVKSGAPNAKADKAAEGANSFATRLYTCCLNRAPEDGGLKYWGLALTNYEKSGYEAALFFFTSDEFKNLKTSNEEYVTRLYTTFMDREPETDGFNYWVGELKNGESRDDVLVSFAESEEFTNICKTYGIERGAV